MNKWMIGMSIIAIGSLMGCSNTNNASMPPNQQGAVENNTQGEMLDEAQAKAIVLDKVPGGKIAKIERDLHDAVPHYEFTIVKDNVEYELEVNAKDGSIREVEEELQKPNAIDESKLIGEARAKEIAQGQVPQGEIIEFSYEGDEYIPNYDISMRDAEYEYDFEIDAVTGEILKSEKNLLQGK